MPLALWLLIVLVVLVGLRWLYNAWPDLQLQDMAQKLGIDRQLLVNEKDRRYLAVKIRMHIKQCYTSFSWRTLQMLQKLSPEYGNPLNSGLRNEILELTNTEPTPEHCRKLSAYLAGLEYEASMRGMFNDYREVQTGLADLTEILKNLDRLRMPA
jgi:hypothetical protein